jgi:hypothetical protein
MSNKIVRPKCFLCKHTDVCHIGKCWVKNCECKGVYTKTSTPEGSGMNYLEDLTPILCPHSLLYDTKGIRGGDKLWVCYECLKEFIFIDLSDGMETMIAASGETKEAS